MKQLKKTICAVLTLLMLATAFSSIQDIEVSAAIPYVTITAPTKRSSYTVQRGATDKKFTIKYKVKNGKVASVTFKSSNKEVATVGKRTGRVVVRKAGNTKITLKVKLTNGQTISDTLKLNVIQMTTNVKVSLADSKKFNGSYYISKDNKKKIKISVSPKDANNKTMRYTSSDKSVAKVNIKGEITALAAGETTITVKAKDGSGVSSSFKLTVIDKAPSALERALSGRKYKGKGKDIVAYAKEFLGTPYVYGGTDLVNGVDCSGFTSQIFAKFGYSLNRVASDQVLNGTKIDLVDLQPGDLVFFDFTRDGIIDHVGIYAGDFVVVHAGSTGVKEGYMAYLPFPTGAVRVIK